MHIPRYWSLSRRMSSADGRLRLQTWGWSDTDEPDAARLAEHRLQTLADNTASRADLVVSWQYYGHGGRPLREEIVDAAPAGVASTDAVVTRNRYGVQVLNTARLLFIDVDLPRARRGLWAWLRRAAANEGEAARLARLQQDLAAVGGLFYVYRTAAGFRALAADRPFDPAAASTRALLQRVGADPLFVRLCAAQASFRARLSPKPWRCGMMAPDIRFPRAAAEQEKLEDWLFEYRRKAEAYAVCRWLGPVGAGVPAAELRPLIEFHDQATRARSDRPLA